MTRLNNKGYMLIEIILATTLAMAVGYFLIELTLKVKNTNDDLLVTSLVRTDQGIIYNMIMEDIYKNPSRTLSEVKNKIKVTNQKIEYDGKSTVLSKYVTIKSVTEVDKKIIIDLDVPQLPEEDFDVIIYVLGDALVGYESEVVS